MEAELTNPQQHSPWRGFPKKDPIHLIFHDLWCGITATLQLSTLPVFANATPVFRNACACSAPVSAPLCSSPSREPCSMCFNPGDGCVTRGPFLGFCQRSSRSAKRGQRSAVRSSVIIEPCLSCCAPDLFSAQNFNRNHAKNWRPEIQVSKRLGLLPSPPDRSPRSPSG